MRKAIPTAGKLHTVLSSKWMGWKEKGLVANIPRPFEGEEKGPGTYCTIDIIDYVNGIGNCSHEQ